jgi:hypothetical protein
LESAEALEASCREYGSPDPRRRSRGADCLDGPVEDEDARQVGGIFDIIEGGSVGCLENGGQCGQISGLGHGQEWGPQFGQEYILGLFKTYAYSYVYPYVPNMDV